MFERVIRRPASLASFLCREFSLGAASLADSLGVALADACGILIQGCLFKANGLAGADFAC